MSVPDPIVCEKCGWSFARTVEGLSAYLGHVHSCTEENEE